MINGIINVYKEKGFTSHDVVAKLRGILQQKKIGHMGTLDPDAEGVLLVCLGKGTKLCSLLENQDKTYVATLRLGIRTDTQDMSGTVLEEREVTASEEEVIRAVKSFIGEYDQIPPMYSALKQNGRKLYELARAGIEVERKPRTVTIASIRVFETALPIVKMEVSCSKGTYIRTLCEDIGQKLECGGCMQGLIRTRAGDFTADCALRLSEIEQMFDNGTIEERVLAVDQVFAQYEKVYVQKSFDKLVHNGNPVVTAQCQQAPNENGRIRLYDSERRFIGIYEWQERQKRFFPVKIFWEKA